LEKIVSVLLRKAWPNRNKGAFQGVEHNGNAEVHKSVNKKEPIRNIGRTQFINDDPEYKKIKKATEKIKKIIKKIPKHLIEVFRFDYDNGKEKLRDLALFLQRRSSQPPSSLSRKLQ